MPRAGGLLSCANRKQTKIQHLLFPFFPVIFCFPVFFFFFGYSYFDTTFLTKAVAFMLHIPCVEHLSAILTSVIAHDLAVCIILIFQGFNWFYIIQLLFVKLNFNPPNPLLLFYFLLLFFLLLSLTDRHETDRHTGRQKTHK
jgi:hypothetical protein